MNPRTAPSEGILLGSATCQCFILLCDLESKAHPGAEEMIMAHAPGSLILVAAVVVLHGPVQAQQQMLPDSCPHLFKANSQGSLSYIEYCVSDTGNITSVNTPFDGWHIGGGEGYGLCQESPIAAYYDYFQTESGNWGAAQTLSVSGNSIKIKRSTAEGNWTLVQTISKVAATGSIKLVMALTNNQSADKIVYLLRYFVSVPGPHTGGASVNSVWSWDNSPNTLHYGLQLLNAGKSPFTYRQGFVREHPVAPNPCDFAASTAPTGIVGPTFAEHSQFLVYAGAVPAGATRTVTLNYRGT